MTVTLSVLAKARSSQSPAVAVLWFTTATGAAACLSPRLSPRARRLVRDWGGTRMKTSLHCSSVTTTSSVSPDSARLLLLLIPQQQQHQQLLILLLVLPQIPHQHHRHHNHTITITTVSVSVSAQDGIVALGKAHTRSAPSLSSLPKVALETVPIFVWLNTDRSPPWRVECRPLPFSTPLSFRRSML